MHRSGLSTYRSLCVTGSGRNLISRHLPVDIVKNEITALWKAATTLTAGAKTVFEIGGQDSKIIAMEDGEITDFRLNSVCAAGTGSFLDQQAYRIGLSLGELSVRAEDAVNPAKFTGRCTVFVETEMINLQQRGYPVEAIASGLFDAVCENFLNDLGAGIPIEDPIIFCGGVSRINAVRKAFEKKLGKRLVVPEMNTLMAAFGAALIAGEHREKDGAPGRRLPDEVTRGVPGGTLRGCDRGDCLNCGRCDGFFSKNR